MSGGQVWVSCFPSSQLRLTSCSESPPTPPGDPSAHVTRRVSWRYPRARQLLLSFAGEVKMLPLGLTPPQLHWSLGGARVSVFIKRARGDQKVQPNARATGVAWVPAWAPGSAVHSAAEPGCKEQSTLHSQASSVSAPHLLPADAAPCCGQTRPLPPYPYPSVSDAQAASAFLQ